MDYLLDTNIWIHLIRESQTASLLEDKYKLLDSENNLYLSIATVAELYVIAKRNKWGQKKLEKLETILDGVNSIPISRIDIVQKYVEIDLFSQGFHDLYSLPIGTTSRNMGKNDLWIAATASLLQATLITTDNDFDHLNGIFLTIEKITTQ